MSDAEQPIPELYREAAEQVRQLARQARLTDIQDDLLALAAKLERLAANADAAIRSGCQDTRTARLFRASVISRPVVIAELVSRPTTPALGRRVHHVAGRGVLLCETLAALSASP